MSAGWGPSPLILLHGRGANEQDLLPLAEELDPRLLVVSARAPLERWAGFHWYDLIESGVPEPTTFGESLQRLQQFLRVLPSAFQIAADRLYLLGFSQGAVMSGSLVLTVPELVAGAVLLSGYLPIDGDLNLPIRPEALEGKPVFIGHGTQDGVLPIGLGRQARDYLERCHASVRFQEYRMDHQISGRELLDISQWLAAQLGERQ